MASETGMMQSEHGNQKQQKSRRQRTAPAATSNFEEDLGTGGYGGQEQTTVCVDKAHKM